MKNSPTTTWRCCFWLTLLNNVFYVLFGLFIVSELRQSEPHGIIKIISNSIICQRGTIIYALCFLHLRAGTFQPDMWEQSSSLWIFIVSSSDYLSGSICSDDCNHKSKCAVFILWSKRGFIQSAQACLECKFWACWVPFWTCELKLFGH